MMSGGGFATSMRGGAGGLPSGSRFATSMLGGAGGLQSGSGFATSMRGARLLRKHTSNLKKRVLSI
jgi:hypothetical protein